MYLFQAAGIRLGMALMSVCSLLAGVIIAFIYSWKLSLIVLAFFPFMAIAGALQMKMLTGAAGKNKEALEASGKVRSMCIHTTFVVDASGKIKLNTIRVNATLIMLIKQTLE